MDKEQIKEEIEKKLYKWGLTLVLSNFSITVIAFLILDEIIPSDIGIYIIIALSIINFLGFLNFSIYVYDIIEERYDEFLKRKQYYEKTSLKDKILDLLTIFWIISPIIAMIIFVRLMSEPLKAIIFGIFFVIFWLITPLILVKFINT